MDSPDTNTGITNRERGLDLYSTLSLFLRTLDLTLRL